MAVSPMNRLLGSEDGNVH